MTKESIYVRAGLVLLIAIAAAGLVGCGKKTGPYPAPEVTPTSHQASARRCREKLRFEDIRGFRQAGREQISYREIEEGNYVAEQVAVMYSLPHVRDASFLFSEVVVPGEWMSSRNPVVTNHPAGDYDQHFSLESWRELESTGSVHSLSHQFDIPLNLQKRGAQILFADAIGYQVSFDQRRTAIVTNRAFPFAGNDPLFATRFLDGSVQPFDFLAAPLRARITPRPQPLAHAIERRGEYFKFTLHFQQPRVQHTAPCRSSGCPMEPTDNLVNTYVQVFYTRAR